MTYKIMLENPIDDDVDLDESPTWISNSYKTIPNYDTADFEKIDREYETTFNIKLIYKPPTTDDDYRVIPDHTIIGVEFPSKDDATLFVLRWS